MIVVVAPSGSGKSTLVSYLMKQFSCLSFSVSATTRDIRNGEMKNKNYYYLSQEDFQEKIKRDLFLEWEMVYEGVYYGTLNEEIERILQEKRIPIVDVDVKGALRIKKKNPKACCIFIDVPSLEVLRQRLIARNTETIEKVNTRIEKAVYERSFKEQFDYCVLNEDLQTATKEIENIVAQYLKQYV